MRAKADYLGARWDSATQERFWSKIDRRGPDECWRWNGPVTPNGYAQFSIGNRHYAAHRLLTVKKRGDALEGLVCDHLCRNRACVNPRHIEVVSNRENLRRGVGPAMARKRARAVSHCPQGHEYTEANTYLGPPRGESGHRSRQCRKCINTRRNRNRARASEAE